MRKFLLSKTSVGWTHDLLRSEITARKLFSADVLMVMQTNLKGEDLRFFDAPSSFPSKEHKRFQPHSTKRPSRPFRGGPSNRGSQSYDSHSIQTTDTAYSNQQSFSSNRGSYSTLAVKTKEAGVAKEKVSPNDGLVVGGRLAHFLPNWEKLNM
jgi:hypothetical protein